MALFEELTDKQKEEIKNIIAPQITEGDKAVWPENLRNKLVRALGLPDKYLQTVAEEKEAIAKQPEEIAQMTGSIRKTMGPLFDYAMKKQIAESAAPDKAASLSQVREFREALGKEVPDAVKKAKLWALQMMDPHNPAPEQIGEFKFLGRGKDTMTYAKPESSDVIKYKVGHRQFPEQDVLKAAQLEAAGLGPKTQVISTPKNVYEVQERMSKGVPANFNTEDFLKQVEQKSNLEPSGPLLEQNVMLDKLGNPKVIDTGDLALRDMGQEALAKERFSTTDKDDYFKRLKALLK